MYALGAFGIVFLIFAAVLLGALAATIWASSIHWLVGIIVLTLVIFIIRSLLEEMSY